MVFVASVASQARKATSQLLQDVTLVGCFCPVVIEFMDSVSQVLCSQQINRGNFSTRVDYPKGYTKLRVASPSPIRVCSCKSSRAKAPSPLSLGYRASDFQTHTSPNCSPNTKTVMRNHYQKDKDS